MMKKLLLLHVLIYLFLSSASSQSSYERIDVKEYYDDELSELELWSDKIAQLLNDSVGFSTKIVSFQLYNLSANVTEGNFDFELYDDALKVVESKYEYYILIRSRNIFEPEYYSGVNATHEVKIKFPKSERFTITKQIALSEILSEIFNNAYLTVIKTEGKQFHVPISVEIEALEKTYELLNRILTSSNEIEVYAELGYKNIELDMGSISEGRDFTKNKHINRAFEK